MQTYDIIVVGAGISGLSLAHYCAKEGLKTLVIEKSDRVGGTLHSHRFENTGGFWLELGAHTCYNSYRSLIGIMEDCRIMDRLLSREKVPFKMLVDSRVKSIPSRLNFFELLLSGPRLFTLKQEGRSVESYYSGIVGRTNYERVIGPAMNAVISQRANDFPANMLFKKRLRRKDVMKKYTLTGGVQTITDAIASQKAFEIVKGKEVSGIKSVGRRFQTTTGDETYESNSLALATPASAAARLLNEPFPALAEKLAQIKVESVESVGVALRKELVSLPPAAGLIPESDSFFSVVTRDTVRDDTYRGFTFHFKPGLLSYSAKLKRISEVLGVKQEQLGNVVAKENFIASLRVGHEALVRSIDQAIAGHQLFLTGNYFDGLAIEDCVARSHKEFSRLKGFIGRPH